VPLSVVSCCTYLTGATSVAWRGLDYDAHDFIHAVKQKPINKYAHIPVRGVLRRLDDSNRDRSLVWFGQMIADVAQRHGLLVPIALVPVPNSRCCVDSTETPRTVALAHALADELNRAVTGDAIVVDVLRWSERLDAAHSGAGTRDPQELFDKLRVVGDLTLADPRRLALVDDVLTSGGHLRACAAKLLQRGYRTDAALVAGRADQTQVADPFAIRVDEIADFTPQ
jgi:predicted amidophosphoribosyltransferase